METLIAYSIGAAAPAVLLYYGLSYLALKSNMKKKGFIRGAFSFFISLLIVSIFNVILTTYKQRQLSVAEEEFVNLAGVLIPLFLTLLVVWLSHNIFIKK